MYVKLGLSAQRKKQKDVLENTVLKRILVERNKREDKEYYIRTFRSCTIYHV
jgi:hypothetical protein